jgi:PIF1-like helicase/Helix-turn-helix domain/Helicase
MSATDITNPYFSLAATFVNQTGQSVFLTGKAGTGKTTFLRYIKETTFKKTAIVAPTGVAAINAGGVTMHSFFGLPFAPYIPVLQGGWNSNAVNKHSLFKNLKLSGTKRELIRELELLIIDEVSMVRADMLDAVDAIMRHYRYQPQLPFGGVQVLFIGDLYQLPPVVQPAEWELLQPHYKSPFFFDAQVLTGQPPVFIELKKIYRQNEANFINLLNNVRNNCVTRHDLDLLHQHYKPDYEPPANEHYITLTTHNAKADGINQLQLEKLSGQAYAFKADVKGDFSDKAYPAEPVLNLKVGAQVMFIKNDKGEVRRYYNGKIATVCKMEEEKIWVQFPNGGDEMQLDKETWKNIRYTYNKEKDNVNEEELGSFTQYPIRLAWAITIHKSQGLTFERAIVDAGASFAPGQVYVALSRLTSLAGLVLHSRISPAAISSDGRVVAFSATETADDTLHTLLKKEQAVYVSQLLVKSFDWEKLIKALDEFCQAFEHRLIPDKNEAADWAGGFLAKLAKEQEVVLKFNRQLSQLLATAQQDNYIQLHQRVAAAVTYFNKIVQEAITSVKEQMALFKIKQRVKKYLMELRDIALLLDRKQIQLQQSLAIAEGLMKGIDTQVLLQQVEEQKKMQSVTTPPIITAPKLPKGETKRISLEMYKSGKTIDDIARERGLVPGTIEGHLASFILTGEISIAELVSIDHLTAINQAMENHPNETGAALKEILGDGFTYGQIRAVTLYRQLLQQQEQVVQDGKEA